MANLDSLKMNAPVNRLIGEMPKIGIRPTIDGRLGGVRESLEEQTMNMARTVAAFLSENLRHYNGLPVECVIADTTIGGVAEAAQSGREVSARGSRRVADGDAVLVLRLRNHGHGSADSQGGVGLQRHRAARCGLSGCGVCGVQSEGTAGLQYLRSRRAGCGRHVDSRRMCRRSCCVLRGRVWRWPTCAASPICPWAACRWASAAPLWTSRSLSSYPGHAR